MSLSSYSDSELEQELKNRKKITPRPFEKPDFTQVVYMCNDYIDKLKNNRYTKDFEHYLYEEVLTSLYGDNIFEWINEQLDN